MKLSLYLAPTCIALLTIQAPLSGQQGWLSDEEAREMAGATVRAVYPEDCYSTYRKEFLESWVLSERREKLAGDKVNRSVYIYSVVADACDFVVMVNGRPELRTEVHTHEPDYGIVAVDRITRRCYWFSGESQPAEVFKQFVKDEQLVLDRQHPILWFALYRGLVRSGNDAGEVTGLSQLRRLVEENFQSAYSPYERDEIWEPRFAAWWKQFRKREPHLTLETTTEATAEGVVVHGFSFKGFELRIPRTDPPPEGTPTLVRWAALMKADGTVETLPSTTVYRAK